MNTNSDNRYNGRDLSIDAARGVALFLVVLSHAHHLPYYLTSFYIIAFFFLSGWLYKPGKSYDKNIRKKAKRVLIPYFVNSAVLLLCFSAFNNFSLEYVKTALTGIIYSRNVIEIGTNPIMISGNAPLWYLTSFFTTSLLFHILVDRYTRDTKTVVLLISVLIIASILLSRIPRLFPWSLEMVPFFTIIMILAFYLKKKGFQLNLSWTVTSIIIIFYCVLCSETGSLNLSIRNYGCGGQIPALLIGLTGTIATTSLCYKNTIAPLQWFFISIGTNSITVLSFHLLFFSVYGALCKRFFSFLNFNITGLPYDLIIVFLSVFSCIVLGKFVEIIRIRISRHI